MSKFYVGLKLIFNKTKMPIMAAIIFGLLLMPISLAESASLGDLYKKQSDLNKEISDKNKVAKEKKQQAEELSKTIKGIDSNIQETEAKIAELQGQIDQTQRNIEETEKNIQQKKEELNQETSNKYDTLREIYETGEQSTLEILISAASLSAVIDQSQYFELLENRIESTIDEIGKLKAELEAKKDESNKKKDELKTLKSDQEAYNYGLKTQKQEKDIVLKDTKGQQKSLESQVAEAQKYSNQVEAQIASLVASINKDNRGVVARDRGTSALGFSWPIDYKYISAYYGESTPFQSFHSGIDLVNIMGTPVHASASGTVVTVADMMMDGHYYGYGKYLVIGHNARYSSLYAHLMSYNVAPGDEVKEGQVIGYLGNTGWSTGPHLHFEIWENGQRRNPLDYLP